MMIELIYNPDCPTLLVNGGARKKISYTAEIQNYGE